MEQRVRMKDIAERLGIDKSTVSLALRGAPRIPQITREKVRRTAEEMGYVRDPALSRLAEQRWRGKTKQQAVSIALLVWDKTDYPDWRKELLAPVKKRAEELGYGFETVTVGGRKGITPAVRILEARGVAGLVVLGSRDPQAWQGFPWERFCGVEVLTGAGRPSGFPVVRYDTFGALLDAGRRVEKVRPESAAILLLQQERPSITDDRDHAAALLVSHRWHHAGIACKEPQLFVNDDNLYQSLISWLKTNRPEVAIIPNAGIYWIIPQSGLEVPGQIRLIAHRRHGVKNFAGYEQRTSKIGELAAQLVDSLIRSNQRGLPQLPETIVVPSQWTPGPSFPET